MQFRRLLKICLFCLIIISPVACGNAILISTPKAHIGTLTTGLKVPLNVAVLISRDTYSKEYYFDMTGLAPIGGLKLKIGQGFSDACMQAFPQFFKETNFYGFETDIESEEIIIIPEIISCRFIKHAMGGTFAELIASVTVCSKGHTLFKEEMVFEEVISGLGTDGGSVWEQAIQEVVTNMAFTTARKLANRGR